MKLEQMTLTIRATPDTLQKFLRFLALMHFNGGHTGTFAMEFDGDGNERLSVDPPLPREMAAIAQRIGGSGMDVEEAHRWGYTAYSIAADKGYYRIDQFSYDKRNRDGGTIKVVEDWPVSSVEATL